MEIIFIISIILNLFGVTYKLYYFFNIDNLDSGFYYLIFVICFLTLFWGSIDFFSRFDNFFSKTIGFLSILFNFYTITFLNIYYISILALGLIFFLANYIYYKLKS